jgi:glycosyltransferase involved in cell wall biosynthesis
MSSLNHDASVLAVIPHYRCEQWLGDAIESLLDQTRPPEAIVVVDDASPGPSTVTAVVARYPQATLLRADANVGPYALVQQVIDATGYDAILFQDADDWSAPQRLATLLDTAERTGAELVGSWELRVLCDAAEAVPGPYPADPPPFLAADPTAFAVLHPTSLVATDLIDRVGGYPTGLRFSGDAEFLWRAHHEGRVANAPAYLYYRRKRAGSLTTATGSGLQSPARLALQIRLHAAARSRHVDAATGRPLDLRPHASIAQSPRLTHVCGPSLRHNVRREQARA